MTFESPAGVVRGRIEGESNPTDLANNQEYVDEKDFMQSDIDLAYTAYFIAIAEEIQAGVAVASAATSSTACAGLGACATAPIPSLIAEAAATLVMATANLALTAADLIIVEDNRNQFIATHNAELGVTFASGSGDYAEYLPKVNPGEKFHPGDVVGVTNGHVTKNTNDADLIMVISLKPIVAGKLPADEDASDYALVAFMGQVPVRIFGEVNPGDYILASGFNNGTGIAKNPKSMRPDDYKKVLGIAWGTNNKNAIGFVNTAIGLNTNDLSDLVTQQENKIKRLEEQMASTDAILADLVPGFAEAANINNSRDDYDQTRSEVQSQQPAQDESHLLHATADQIVYFPVERSYLEEAFRLVEDATKKTGMDLNKHPFWNRIHTDPGYKEELFVEYADKLKTAVHTHQEINERLTEDK
jgi:hypothetical protein